MIAPGFRRRSPAGPSIPRVRQGSPGFPWGKRRAGVFLSRLIRATCPLRARRADIVAAARQPGRNTPTSESPAGASDHAVVEARTDRGRSRIRGPAPDAWTAPGGHRVVPAVRRRPSDIVAAPSHPPSRLRRYGGQALAPRTVAPTFAAKPLRWASLRTLAPSHPRTLAPSHLRTFAPSHPYRSHVAELTKAFASAISGRLAGLAPQSAISLRYEAQAD